jgi:putative ABC transport system ATP-binding protein
MSDEIKDKNGLEEEKSPNLENSSAESEQDAAEDANEEISTEKHSDYKPVNRFDASAVHHLSGMYQNWFLDYASYVILERAVPHIEDGLKPVQRRILHSMKRMDDGRYNKVANIVGQSGSGKSTLLSILAGLERADTGDISVDKINLTPLTEQELTLFRAQNIAIVFQQYHLISHLTALENVMLALEILKMANAKERAEEVLKELGLGHRLNHFPSQLSGGECQRVAIARALVVKPKILLADEPSGNLDTHTGDKVMDVFFDVVRKQKITTILVTHSEALAQRCGRRLRLEEGILKDQ